MINDKNIFNKKLTGADLQAFEKASQQTDLDYLSHLAFDKFKVNNDEIEALKQKITKKAPGTKNQFNAIFISLLCGLLIGISVFFIFFQKSKNHASIFQQFSETQEISKNLNNKVSATDTVFPEIKNIKKAEIKEHFASIENTAEDVKQLEITEELPILSSSVSLTEPKEEKDIILQFIPNAPVVFMSNLKVTNYRLYYFKRNEAVNLSINTGLSAQYENNSSIENNRLSKSDSYYAHKIIQRAMKLFDSKSYANCIEELNLLYDFNKHDANAQFYLGMCYFLQGKYAFAQGFFTKNIDNENNIFHQESEFYEALCMLNNKQNEEAKSRLQKIANSKGFYSDRAKEVLLKNQ